MESSAAVVPFSPADVTKKWLENELKSCAGVNTVHIHQIQPLNQNAGFLSAIFSAEAAINGERKKLFIKMSLSGENELKQFVDDFDADITEIKAYTKYLPMLVEFEKNAVKSKPKRELEKSLPKFYTGAHKIENNQRGYFLIMQDLTENNEMMQNCLTMNQMKIALRKIARLHAVGFALLKNAQEQEILADVYLRPKVPQYVERAQLVKLLDSCFASAQQLFASSATTQHLAKPVEFLSQNYTKFWLEIFTFEQNQKCFTHGDFWLTNIMFGKTGENDCVLFDWQYFSIDHPCVDFAVMVFTGLDLGDQEQELAELFKAYYQKLESSCKEVGLNGPPFTLKEFMDETMTKGLMATLFFAMFGFKELYSESPFKERMINMIETGMKRCPQFFFSSKD